MSINAKFQELNQCKADIRQALINKKIDMTDVPFTEYANKVNSIKGGSGNATVDQVLTGATFTNSTGEELTGTMPNNGAVTHTFIPSDEAQTYNIPKGYHNGSGKVTCEALTLIPKEIGFISVEQGKNAFFSLISPNSTQQYFSAGATYTGTYLKVYRLDDSTSKILTIEVIKACKGFDKTFTYKDYAVGTKLTVNVGTQTTSDFLAVIE